jgi:hypothetical protein
MYPPVQLLCTNFLNNKEAIYIEEIFTMSKMYAVK